MRPAFEEAAETVSTEGLHDADVNVGVVVPEESFAIERDEAGKPVEIMIEELLAQIRREVGLGVVQERSDVVLQSASAAALVVDEKGIAVAQHDVAGLEVTVKKIIARGTEKKFGEAAETGIGIADFVIQVAAGFHLKAGENGDNLAIGFDHLGEDVFTSAVIGKELEERGVAKVFFKIGAVA